MKTIELNDPFTGEWIVFEETNNTYNGNSIIDSICDGIIYKKVDGKYYRRVLENDTINVKWFGALGDDNNDDTQSIQKAVKIGKNVFFPAGKYIISSAISLPVSLGGLSIKGVGYNPRVNGTILKSSSGTNLFNIDDGANYITFSDIMFDGCNLGKIAINARYGGGLILQKIGIYNYTEYGLYSQQGLLRITDSYFQDNTIGAQIYSDSSISNCEFNGGSTTLKLVAGGNRLTNVWCNTSTVSCLEISPLDTTVGHQNTSITNLYIGEVNSQQAENNAIIIKGNDVKRVQQVHISNSFLVHAEGKFKSINNLIYLENCDDIILNGINVLGKGLYANNDSYTSGFVKGKNSNNVTINACTINGINKSPIYQGINCYDWNILNNNFINCCDKIAINSQNEGANIYVSQSNGRTSIKGNKFVVASGSNIPFAAYITSINSMEWSNNYISYPNSDIIKDQTGNNDYAGSHYREGTDFQFELRKTLENCNFQNGWLRPINNLKNGQFFYDNNLNKPIWYDATNGKWKDAQGSIV